MCQLLAELERIRTPCPADAGLVVHCPVCAGRGGHLIRIIHYLCVAVGGFFADGVTLCALASMLVFIGLDPLRCVVDVRREVAVRLAAHFALGFLRTTGRAAAVGGYTLYVPADGAFLPVVSCVFFGAVIVLAGEEFDCCSISLSFGDDADGAVAAISVGEIGRLGNAGDALRNFHSFVRRRRGRGHDDSARGLTKVAGKAEVDSAGIQMHIVCRAAGQLTVFTRCAALRVAAEIHAAGKGDF